MAVDDGDGVVICNADMVGLDANDGAELLVYLIDIKVALAPSASVEQPKVAPRRRERGGYVSQVAEGGEVGNCIVHDQRQGQQGQSPRREEQVCQGHAGIGRVGKEDGLLVRPDARTGGFL